MNTDRHPVRYVPYAQDPLEAAAAAIAHQFSHSLPDLTPVVVLLPRTAVAQRLRRHLLDAVRGAGFTALLGPHIDDLRHWVGHHHPVAGNVPNHHARELMLVEALLDHPRLFGRGNPWALAASLIELFDELTLHQTELPAGLDDFTRRLHTAYGLKQPALGPLTHEARLVYTLWRAWHDQIRAEGLTDGQAAYVEQLSALPNRLPDHAFFYFVGQNDLLPAEQAFVRTLISRGQAALFLHGHPATHPLAGAFATLQHGDTLIAGAPYSEFLDGALGNVTHDATTMQSSAPRAGIDIRTRAQTFTSHHPENPASGRLFAFAARGQEQEARAVELQVRRWLLDGHQRVGIVTEDRRLARRVRALLERANVSLRDSAGWALSTTSAAAALERWLEAVEQDYYHQPLVDLMRSPFIFPDRERAAFQAIVYRFEQDVVINENVARGLDRYHQALASRRRRLETADFSSVHALLDELERAGAPLLPLINDTRHAPGRLLDALTESMSRLGQDRAFARDAAGDQVLQVLDDLRHSLTHRSLTMTWMEFRSWLGRALEQNHFSPEPTAAQVELLGLEQSMLGRFDALIIAGLDAQHLPGEERTTPFFNNSVRLELGLSPANRHRQLKYYHFRRLLESAPRILLTHCAHRDAEHIIPSPWLALLQAFHHLAYGGPLGDNDIALYMEHPHTMVTGGDGAPLPGRKSHPTPRVDRRLIPDTVTATSYQQLVNCPYQFFAAQCLTLTAPEPVTEKLQKSDYGNRIHLILQAFHDNVPNLPGPFQGPLTEQNREQAETMLRDISAAVFARDLEDNFLHRGWLHRWEMLIPDYIDWQINHARQWRVQAVEVKTLNEDFSPLFKIKGRLDRIDAGPDGMGIIDYKTGAVPSQDDIDRGEAVQLPFYALLSDEPVTRAQYLCLDKSRMSQRRYAEGDALTALRDNTAHRLLDLMTAMHQGAALPAWGDENTCEYCRMSGLCRKQAWQTSA